MEWNEILIRYGEISLKGRNRKKFTEKLRENIKQTLANIESLTMKTERDRMFLYMDASDMQTAIEKLPAVFGIHSFSPIAKCESTVEGIKEKAKEVIGSQQLEGKTFKVEVKRTDKSFPLTTGELQQEVGSCVLRNYPQLTVQMKKPDILLHIDIRDGGAFLSASTYKGAGGMPIGSNGRSLLMLSGGIDSPVAGYLMMKRGVAIDAIHFASPPFTSEMAKKKVLDLAEQLSTFGAAVRVHVIPFTDIQQTISGQIPSNVTMTTTRRMMLRIADLVREDIHALGIITGESLGQVASQTMESLTAINEVTNTPILRPLISMDKLDIIEISRQIGTYDLSIQPYEDCCTVFSPPSPKTKPKLEKVQYYEGFTDFEALIEKAVAGRVVYELPVKTETAFEDLL